jgi:hypothetical protein
MSQSVRIVSVLFVLFGAALLWLVGLGPIPGSP